MFRIWMLPAIVVCCAVIAAASVSLPRMHGAASASAVIQSPFELYLDCAPGGAIDDACSLPPGTPSFDIDVVAKNNSGGDSHLAAFSAWLSAMAFGASSPNTT